MRKLGFASLGVAAVITVASLVSVAGQAPTTAAGAALKTSWGEPDLMGIWDTSPTQIPLQRPTKYAGREFFTDAERAALDAARTDLPGKETRAEKGTPNDVAGAYNAVFNSNRHTGLRTSLIIDPPDGRIPPVTPAVMQRRAEEKAYVVALVAPTDTCKFKWPGCAGGTFGPPSPRRFDPPPTLTSNAGVVGGQGRYNRSDGPEDYDLSTRCFGAAMPDFGGYRQIVQSPGAVSIFYDTGQGQGWERIINITSAPHLPANIRTWWGDSRGRWEGNTLVVDVTNFNGYNDYNGSTTNLHLIERFTRTGPNTIEYVVTLDDPTAWTKPWTVKQEYAKQDDQLNRFYKEPRCHEGNYGMIGQLSGARQFEQAFAEGRGPDPLTVNYATPTAAANVLAIQAGEEDADPLTQ